METPTDHVPAEPTIPVLVQEYPQPPKCAECEDSLFGYHHHTPSTTFSFHLSWWTLWIVIAIVGYTVAAAQGKSF